MTKNKNTKLDKCVKICITLSWIAAGIIFLLWIISLFFHSTSTFDKGVTKALDAPWTFTTSSGLSGQCTFPVTINMKFGETVDLSATLPNDIRDGDYLLWRSGRNYVLYIDGEIREQYHAEDAWLPGGNVKGRLWAIRISSADAGKTIRVVRDEPNVNNATFATMYYGDMYGVASTLLDEYGFRFIASLLLLFIAIVLLIINFGISKIYGIDNLSLRLLGYGMVTVAAWAITDSYLYQVAFGENFYSGLVGYMITPIIPIVFIRYLDEVQQNRNMKLYLFLIFLLLADFVVTGVLHFANIMSYQRTLGANDGCVAFVCGIVIFLLIKDCIDGHIKQYKWVGIGLILFIIMTFAEMALINFVDTYPTGIFMMLGIYTLMTCAMVHTIGDIITSEREKRAAIDASIVKTTFLANMSHEIRTPINSIIGMNEMIMRENIDEDIAIYADHIKRSCNLLMSIIGDVLDFSKIESGRLNLVTDPYKTADLVNDLCTFLAEQAAPKSLEIKTDVSASIPSVLEGDENRIKQIVINLITNAAKYTKSGFISLKVYATDAPSETLPEGIHSGKNIMLNFEVTDTGIGIREEDVSKLFDSFTRIDEKKNRNIQGTGLGLSIVKALTGIMNGTVDVQSKYGKGSTFTVQIPQHVVDSLPIGADWKFAKKEKPEPSSYKASFKAPGKQILVVDDNESNLMVIRQLLKHTEVHTDLIDNGRDAVGLCEQKKYDLILLDHMMPEFDGIDVLHSIKEHPFEQNYHTPVIVLTANATEGSRQEYLELGFDDYISKPVSGATLEAILAKYLADDAIGDSPHLHGADGDCPQLHNPEAAYLEEFLGEEKFKQVMLYCGGREFACRVMAKVAEDSLKALGRMRLALDQGDLQAYALAAHSIKGMMGSACQDEIQVLARNHETAAKEGRADFLEKDYDNFALEVSRFCLGVQRK